MLEISEVRQIVRLKSQSHVFCFLWCAWWFSQILWFSSTPQNASVSQILICNRMINVINQYKMLSLSVTSGHRIMSRISCSNFIKKHFINPLEPNSHLGTLGYRAMITTCYNTLGSAGSAFVYRLWNGKTRKWCILHVVTYNCNIPLFVCWEFFVHWNFHLNGCFWYWYLHVYIKPLCGVFVLQCMVGGRGEI